MTPEQLKNFEGTNFDKTTKTTVNGCETHIKQYTMTLAAQSKTNSDHAAHTEVVISVIDANDNTPAFTGDRKASVEVLNTAKKNAVVHTLAAADADSCANAEIVFSILDSNQSDLFDISGKNVVIKETLREQV